MTCGYMGACGFTVKLLIVEENIGLVGSEKLGFIQASQKDRLVYADVPGSQSKDYALVGWSRPGGNHSFQSRNGSATFAAANSTHASTVQLMTVPR